MTDPSDFFAGFDDAPVTTRWTDEELTALDRAIGDGVTLAGEVLTDPDGVPVAMMPNEHAFLGGVILTRTEVRRCGLEPADYPNISFIDDPQEGTNHD